MENKKMIHRIFGILEKLQVDLAKVDIQKILDSIDRNKEGKIFLNQSNTIMRLKYAHETVDIDISKRANGPYSLAVVDVTEEDPDTVDKIKKTIEEIMDSTVQKNNLTEEDDYFDDEMIASIKRLCSHFNNKIINTELKNDALFVTFANDVVFRFNKDNTITMLHA